MNYQNNGRMPNVDRRVYDSYSMFQSEENRNHNSESESIKSIIESNPVSQVFFSKMNRDLLQRQLQEGVFKASNGQYKIGRQSDIELQIIMKSHYLQYSVNRPDNVRGQIIDLNKGIIDEFVPSIMTKINQKLCYERDISTMYRPMDRPAVDNSKGEKGLELKPFF